MLGVLVALGIAAAGDEPVVVTSVKWKQRSAAIHPLEAALDPVPASIRCRAVVTVERDGRVRQVRVDDCQGAYGRATRETLRAWVAEPVVHKGEAVRALVPLELEFQSPIPKDRWSADGAGWSEVDWGRPDCAFVHPSAINVQVRTELTLEPRGRTGFDGLTCRFLALVEGGEARAIQFQDCAQELRGAALVVREQWRWDELPGCTLVSAVAAYRDLPPLSEVDADIAPLVRLHVSELYTTQRADMVWPSDSVRDKLLDAVCLVDVTLGTDGVVAKAAPTLCPGPMKKAAQAAAMQWRWAPPMLDGQPVRAVTEIAVAAPAAL